MCCAVWTIFKMHMRISIRDSKMHSGFWRNDDLQMDAGAWRTNIPAAHSSNSSVWASRADGIRSVRCAYSSGERTCARHLLRTRHKSEFQPVGKAKAPVTLPTTSTQLLRFSRLNEGTTMTIHGMPIIRIAALRSALASSLPVSIILPLALRQEW